MKSFFKFEEHNTTYKKEIYAGILSFITISYLIFLIPLIFHKNLGLPLEAFFLSTVVSGAIATLLMGLFSNLPVVLLAGIGPMAWFIFGVMFTNKFTFEQALLASFISGILMLVLSLTGFRSSVIRAIPTPLKHAFIAGIGLFIVVIGLKQAHVIEVDLNTLSKIIVKDNIQFYFTVISLLILVISQRAKFFGGFLIVLLISVILNLFLNDFKSLEDSSSLLVMPNFDTSNFFKFDFSDIFNVSLLVMALVTFLSNFLDATGVLMSITKKVDKGYDSKEFKRGLVFDSIGVMISSLFGISPSVSTLESHSGIISGGRTGFVAVVVSILLVLSLFLYPILKLIPSWGSGPILIYIGINMFKEILSIDSKDDLVLIPCILAVVIPGLTFSIPNGFGLAILFYLIIGVLFKKIKIKDILPLFSLLLIYFIYLYMI